MNRSLGRNWGWGAWAFTLLLPSAGLLAQAPEQHWQPSPNYPANNPPNYQPSTNAAGPITTGNPGNGAQAVGQYAQQPDQPVGPPQYPSIDRRPTGQPLYGPPQADNRGGYPQQDPRAQGMQVQGMQAQGMQGQGVQVQGVAGQPIQGPPAPVGPPKAPFVLSPPEAAALENLLTDWEKRNKEIHLLESKFFRWKYDSVFNNGNQPPAPEEGILKFAAPDKGLMKIDAKDETQSEQWLCDGKSIFQWNYANKDKKVVKEYIMPPELQGKGIGDGPLPFVFGIEAEKLKQRYFMRIITPPNVQNEVWLEAYPRYQQQAAEFSKVQVILQIAAGTRALLPYAIQIYSPNGKDRTVYQLQNPSINPSVLFRRVFDDWTKPSIGFGWTREVDLPPAPIQAGLNPSAPPRR